MTPEWSRALALLQGSSLFRGPDGMERRERFFEAAAQYATYDDMPSNLKAMYQRASRALRSNA
jgi:hypothetical protein